MPKKDKDEAVKVVVRCRPLSSTEQTKMCKEVVTCNTDFNQIKLKNASPLQNTRLPVVSFDFDAVYGPEASQDKVYELVEPMIYSVLGGINCTIFAYGQTGTGKTYTMDGSIGQHETRGIIWHSLEQIFSFINQGPNKSAYTVTASYLEIYGDDIRDLLGKRNCKKCELHYNRAMGGAYIENLTSVTCKNVKEIEAAVEKGSGRRATAATKMNDLSSRSHAILQIKIHVEMKVLDRGSLRIVKRTSKLNLVDLAGSERQSKTDTTGVHLKEAAMTNKSLSCLGNVIAALSSKKRQHVPYRDSKLTRILEDSLGGNSKTLVFANVGPASYNYEETFSTLMYAQRAKKIVNQPSKNEKFFGLDGKAVLSDAEMIHNALVTVIEFARHRREFMAWRVTNPRDSQFDTRIVQRVYSSLPVNMRLFLANLRKEALEKREEDLKNMQENPKND